MGKEVTYQKRKEEIKRTARYWDTVSSVQAQWLLTQLNARDLNNEVLAKKITQLHWQIEKKDLQLDVAVRLDALKEIGEIE